MGSVRMIHLRTLPNSFHARVVAARLGADVPACLLSRTCRGEGRGDRLQQVDGSSFSLMPLLIVNPLVPVSTARVFAAWDRVDRGALEDWREGRNDLEAPARALAPEIGEVLERLGEAPGVQLSRMSGSGASCFALFQTEAARDGARERIEALHPDWWQLATRLR